MLKRQLRLAATAALCALAYGAATGDAATKEPEKKRWEQLRDKPVDYTPYERRRAKNIQLGAVSTTHALAAGFATAADLKGAAYFVDPAISKGLEVELRKLLPEQLGIKPPPIEILLVDDLGAFSEARASGHGMVPIDAILAKQASVFTMESVSGGAIVVGLSALKVIKSFDELDFFLAHETSHILYDHHSELETRDKINEVIAVGVLIALLATQRSDSNTQENVAWSAVGLIVAGALGGIAWERKQEYEADELGYELLMEAGLSAEGSNNDFEKLQQREEAFQAFLDLMCGPDSAGERFFKRLIGSFFGIVIPEQGYAPYSAVCQKERRDVLARLFRKHPKIDDRKKGIEKHNTKFYTALAPRTVTGFPNGASSVLEYLSPNGEASRLVKTYDGLTAFHNGDLATARAIARQVLTRGKDEVQVPVLELGFHVAKADGDWPKAMQYLEWAMAAPTVVVRMFEMAQAEYAKHARWGDAARVIEMRLHLGIGRPDQFYPQLILYLRLANQLARMNEILTACKALGQVGMTLACEAMAHPREPPSPPPVPAEAPTAPPPATPPGTPPTPGTPPAPGAAPPAQ